MIDIQLDSVVMTNRTEDDPNNPQTDAVTGYMIGFKSEAVEVARSWVKMRSLRDKVPACALEFKANGRKQRF